MKTFEELKAIVHANESGAILLISFPARRCLS